MIELLDLKHNVLGHILTDYIKIMVEDILRLTPKPGRDVLMRMRGEPHTRYMGTYNHKTPTQ